jgi:hypothetical protein
MKMGEEIVSKMLAKISGDVGISTKMESIKAYHTLLNFELTHPINSEILRKIKSNPPADAENVSLNSRSLTIESKRSKLYIFVSGKVLFSSSRVNNEDEVMKYIDGIFASNYKCSQDCLICSPTNEMEEDVYVQSSILYI